MWWVRVAADCRECSNSKTIERNKIIGSGISVCRGLGWEVEGPYFKPQLQTKAGRACLYRLWSILLNLILFCGINLHIYGKYFYTYIYQCWYSSGLITQFGCVMTRTHTHTHQKMPFFICAPVSCNFPCLVPSGSATLLLRHAGFTYIRNAFASHCKRTKNCTWGFRNE